MDLRKAILNEMSKKGVTRSELADQAGYTRGYISRILDDGGSIKLNSIRALIRIAKVLNVKVWRLVKRAEEKGDDD